MRNGTDFLCESLIANDIEVCFANPGTSEMYFVASLDKTSDIRCVLGLFEGVVTGAADGYGRMAEKAAVTLLHLGPGLANGLANLHNARRASTPVLNVVGDHASHHLKHDAPLTSDIESLAKPMSDWVKRSESIEELNVDIEDAIRTTTLGKGKVSTLILPADVAGERCFYPPRRIGKKLGYSSSTDGKSIYKAAAAIRSQRPTLLLLGGRALREPCLNYAAKIESNFNVDILAETSNARMQRGQGRLAVDRLPYAVDAAIACLSKYETIILVDAKDPVAFFAYPGKPSVLRHSNATVIELLGEQDSPLISLSHLADELNASKAIEISRHSNNLPPVKGTNTFTGDVVSQLVAKHLPEHAIVCDESITQSKQFFTHSLYAQPHDYLQLTGGAIGMGMPLALGASVACPDRKVINLEGDGSGMFTLQALWSQARENSNCLTIIYANRSYQILQAEMRNMGIQDWGKNAHSMLDLDGPFLDWVSLAKGMGVEARRVETAEDFERALLHGLASDSPYLIEALI